ncbi:MAG TPA: homoserine kinase [Solirubrobacteraceae bacterium]|jgi:homoserine kinase|nr:homoserine kinase [Solirubrobacteraceae bacterium]
MARHARVRVPASSANLGPGFDVLAAALSLHVELEVSETGRFSVDTDLDIARDRRNLCVRGFAKLHQPDAFAFRIRSTIPLSGGLGSSAAAYVAGLTAAAAVLRRDEDLLAAAIELEGHPDNVAAALAGGFVIVTGGELVRFDPPAGLESVIVVPHAPVRTSAARRVLPASVPLADAAANVGFAALLTLGLARGDLELVARGLGDRLHQPYRAHLYPRSTALLARAAELGAIGATISGSGPTVLFWTQAGTTAAVCDALRREAGDWAQVIAAPFERAGAAVVDA